MKIRNNHRLQLLIQNNLFVLGFLVVILLLGSLSYQYKFIKDVTQNQRNTLTQASINALAQINEPINIVAFVTNSPDKGKYFRKTISSLVGRYQLAKPNLTLTFIDPTKEPKRTKEADIQSEGEMVVTYQKRSEHMTLPYTEQDLTNLIIRLSRTHEQSIAYLTGHGEHNLASKEALGFASFNEALTSKGFQLTMDDLSKHTQTPSKETLLMIAAPQSKLTPDETQKIKKQLEAGGNLLWLLDDSNLQGLNEVADYLTLTVSDGVVMDNSNLKYGLAPTLVTANHYANHPIMHSFALRSFFPKAHKVSATGSLELGWKAQPLIGAAANGWLETDISEYTNPKKHAAFNQGVDSRGPITIGLVLERTYDQKGQRVVVIGNSQFLSNHMIGSGGNLDLGLNIVNWLVNDNRLISTQKQPLKDSVVMIPQDKLNHYLILFIFNSFQFLIPLLLLFYGAIIWRRHRRA